MPATSADAYHLLRHSLTLPDLVVFIEHKALYAKKEEADLSAPAAPWGKAVVRRDGERVVVTYSRMVHVALEAAERLAAMGIDITVIDLLTLNPLDMETVTAAVNRCGRAVVLSEGHLTGGVAAELASRVSEECFDVLEDPVVRIAGEDVPISVSLGLEAASIPTVDLVVETIERMAGG